MSDDQARSREDLFWDLAEELYADPAVTRSTMMGFPCLRVDGAFFASLEKDSKCMIVKLSAERVRSLVESGEGASFAPAGRVFRERVAFEAADEDRWRALLAEAKEFVGG